MTPAASPELVQAIENNILLKQAMGELKEIKAIQETDHLVIVALRDHKTIERLDKMWIAFTSARWVIGSTIGLLIAILGALYTTHSVWGWPR
jgi:hypothetical protein